MPITNLTSGGTLCDLLVFMGCFASPCSTNFAMAGIMFIKNCATRIP